MESEIMITIFFYARMCISYLLFVVVRFILEHSLVQTYWNYIDVGDTFFCFVCVE